MLPLNNWIYSVKPESQNIIIDPNSEILNKQQPPVVKFNFDPSKFKDQWNKRKVNLNNIAVKNQGVRNNEQSHLNSDTKLKKKGNLFNTNSIA